MQFKDFIIGQQFKPIGDDRVYTKGTYAGMYRSSTQAFASYAHHNNNWVCFPSEYIVRTLQKVTKTEKKWVEKKLRDTNRGQEFKFGPGSHEGVMIRLENHTEELKRHTFYVARDGSYLSTGIPWAPVWVEEDTVVETEEWL